MSTLMIRRHCYTKKGEGRGKGSHLSTEGVRQARRMGETMGPFDLVWTSHIPRTLETALAMGFAVDDQRTELGEIPLAVWDEIGHHERWEWQDPFGHFAMIIAQGGATASMGKQQKDVWTQAAQSIGAKGQALIISHGRVIEAGLVSCFPTADFAAWGRPFGHGEGVDLVYSDQQFKLIRLHRND